MNNVKLPQPPSVCPSITPSTGLSDIRMQYKGPRVNKAKLSLPLSPSKITKKPLGLEDITAPLPDNFNWRDNQYVNIETPRDQGLCGSCWAFSSSTALGDRYAIKFSVDGKVRGPNLAESKVLGIKAPKPSTTWTLSCASPNSDNGCDGGFTGDAFTFFGTVGAKSEACWPYSLVQNNPANISQPNPQWFSYPCLNAVGDNCCESCCGNPLAKNKMYSLKLNNSDYYNPLFFTDDNNNFDLPASILNIKKEIYTKGPVVSAFAVYNDFFDFWSNQASDPDAVYIPNASSGYDGGHAIVIVGWGVNSKGIQYWLIRNSWGNQEGDGGYFKMARSDQIPNKSNWNGIDVPILENGEILGGALTFDIPDTLDFVAEKYNGASGTSESQGIMSSIQPFVNSVVSGVSSPLGISIIVGLFVLFILFKLRKKL
jgi:cathepsin B